MLVPLYCEPDRFNIAYFFSAVHQNGLASKNEEKELKKLKTTFWKDRRPVPYNCIKFHTVES